MPDPSQVKATFEHVVPTIHVPKQAEQERSRRIEVQSTVGQHSVVGRSRRVRRVSTPRSRTIWVVAASTVIAVAVLLALTWRPPIGAVEPPARWGFDPALVKRGEQLAGLGNCAACHSSRDGAPYAGGVPLSTPFGTVHGTNVTPDPETGIGRWSEAAFQRAMRDGVSRNGTHLYPVFPYEHFRNVPDDELHALYAYLMTREPVTAEAPSNQLQFPLGFRPLLAGWKLLFLDAQPVQSQPRMSAEWNRGAYLAESLGHCSSCHSPRNALGAEGKGRHFDGGEADGWYAPALNGRSPSPLPWTVDQLTAYLRTGLARDHAIAGGPMQGVVQGLSRASLADVRSLAVYINSTMGEPTPQRDDRAKASIARTEQEPRTRPLAVAASGASVDTMARLGASVYADACATCHDLGRTVSSGGALQLPLAVALHEPDPRSLIRIVLQGVAPPEGERGRVMPAFASELDDEQVTALLSYLRRQVAGELPWPDLGRRVKQARGEAVE